MATPAPHLVDDIMEEIFLRLPTPEALARASTACPSFHRIITARAFLRRFRKLHPPPLLGFVSDIGCFHPAEEPHPSAPLARSLADAADFTYSFVPKPHDGLVSPWSPRDIRDGRVLLECFLPVDIENLRSSPPISVSDCGMETLFAIARGFLILAVCDPLSRRYVLLPPIPQEMTTQQEYLVQFEPMLVPVGDDEDETSFKVICTVCYKTKLVALVFSSLTRQWYVAASPSWSSLGTVQPTWRRLDHFSYTRGCFYWTELWKDKLLVLDSRIMEFSTVDFGNLPGSNVCISTIVDGTKGALEMLTLAGHVRPVAFCLYHFTQQNGSGWKVKNVIEVPRRCIFSTMGAKEGFLFLRDVQDHSWEEVNFFSLEVKTSELKKICRAKYYTDRVHSYFGFPPSLSKPSL